ncbi:polysaccharide deacetylase family protein [Neobacillus sp. SM06]|uniref:polysaccharide deacetylase n=1 Tax=Neobacillus sp. SM06 TaxID=3422492 RepID=UPI003D2A1A6C
MKKWWLLLLIILSIAVLKSGQALSLTSTETKPVHRTAINKPVFFSDSAKITENQLVYMPIFTLSETLKLEFTSDPESRTIVLKKSDRWIRFSVSTQQVSSSTGLREPVKIIKKNNNLYLPMQLVATFFGYNAQVSTSEDFLSQEQEFKKHLLKTFSLQLRKEQPKTQKKVVYLTFDDDPNQHLEEILDILKAKKAKATFFLLEPQIRAYRDAVKRLVAEGHYPALHSVTHDKNKLYSGSPQNVINEMEQTRKTLLEVTGVDSKLTRAPYGSKPYMTEPFRNALADDGLKMWDWNIDSMDWKYQQTDPAKILENIQKGFELVKNKSEPIVILMHVTKGTAAILPQVIDYLSSQGYGFAAYNPQNHVQMNFWEDPRL